jgi:hypothetical protein
MSERWETVRALSMILFGAVTLSVASALVDRLSPPREMTITVHFDGPLMVR